MSISSNTSLRSVFVVWNNPEWDYVYQHDIEGNIIYDNDKRPVIVKKNATILNGLEPKKMCERVVSMWCDSKPGRTGACVYCISPSGLHHLHMVLECSSTDKFRYSAVQKIYGQKFHLEPTRGNKSEVYDYIHKLGKHEEKGEVVVADYQHGEIIGKQGNRSDLDAIGEMIEQGMTPRDILSENFRFYRYENMIRKAFYDKREKDTEYFREVKVFWHYGYTGTGKSYWAKRYVDEHGPNDIFKVSQYKNGFFDRYCGERLLYMEELRGDKMEYSELLQICDGYKDAIHCRFSDIIPLWREVHITSPFTPEEVYNVMIPNFETRKIDTLEQLMRRIDVVIHHSKDESGYHQFEIESEKLMFLKDQRQVIEDYERFANAKN